MKINLRKIKKIKVLFIELIICLSYGLLKRMNIYVCISLTVFIRFYTDIKMID